jgi:hypothetical protein
VISLLLLKAEEDLAALKKRHENELDFQEKSILASKIAFLEVSIWTAPLPTDTLFSFNAMEVAHGKAKN